MATLILTAVGTAIGGPIGGAIGAIVGQQVDQAVFKPAARQGPRLSDLAVQTSTYGAQIPKLFGRTRVSGTVIWSTDLIETKKRRSNGKGRASTDVYSYSASFAVLLSARPIARVGRIWADGKLLRGAAGDMKVEGVLRVHGGSADQVPDPMIAAAEGADAPAYRGSAYAVFEGLQLGDYGNRIPSLSFEVIADEGPVDVGAMLGELAGAEVDVGAGPVVAGLAATGGSVRAVAETLTTAFPMRCRADARAHVRFVADAVAAIDADDLGASSDGRRAERNAIEIAPAETVASAVTLAYFDSARDYQPGLQRARRDGPGRREERVDLPVTLDAGAAHAIAQATLATRLAERTRNRVALPFRWMTVRAGDDVGNDGEAWRVSELRFEAMRVMLSLVRRAVAAGPATAVAPGRATSQIDLAQGPTSLAVIDLPPLSDGIATAPAVAVFAGGASPGWRRADLMASIDGGASFTPIGSSALPATLGITVSVLPPASPLLIDRVNALVIDLIDPAMTLASADTNLLLGGANAAMIGGELIQFGRAVEIAPGRWQLSELWRGRRGTEDAIVAHPAGTRFVLLDADTAVAVPDALAKPGLIVMAAGLGDSAPYPQASTPGAGRAQQPLSPVQLSAARLANGDTRVSWVRRSRDGWAWRDGVDAAVVEDSERYRVVRTAGAETSAQEVSAPEWLYTAAARAADTARGATSVSVAISQLGSAGVSPPATVSIFLP